MYGSLWRVYGSRGKQAVYVSVGQSTGSLGLSTAVYRKSTAVYRKSTAVYGSVGEATRSLGESTGSKEMSSQVLGGLGEFTVV